MRPVNLLPKDGPRDRRTLPSPGLLAAGAAPVVAAVAVYAGWSTEHAKAHDRAAELDAAKAQVQALRPTAQGTAAARLASLRVSRGAAVEDVLAKRVAWDGLLQAIARVLPGDVWLDQLVLQAPTPFTGAPTSSTSTSPQGLQMGGFARSQAAVAHALARLAVVPGLSDVTLASTTSSTVGKKPVVQFQISATVAGS